MFQRTKRVVAIGGAKVSRDYVIERHLRSSFINADGTANESNLAKLLALSAKYRAVLMIWLCSEVMIGGYDLWNGLMIRI